MDSSSLLGVMRMPIRLRTSPQHAVVLWLLLAGGCVNLTPPWATGTDASSQTGGSASGGGAGTPDTGAALATGGSVAGGARGSDAAGTGGLGSGGVGTGAGGGAGIAGAGAGGAGIGGTDDSGAGAGGAGGGVNLGGSAAVSSGGAGGVLASGGSAAGGAGGGSATGGSTSQRDALPPADQAPKNDRADTTDALPTGDAAIDAPAPSDLADVAMDTTIIVPTQGLVAYYPCEQASGATLPDLSSAGHDATLAGATSFAPGKVGNGLVLTAVNGVDGGSSGGYATLPAGIVAGATEMTVTAWFTITTTVGFQRIFDFGTSSTTSSMYLTPRNTNGLPQFSIRLVPDGGTEIKQDLKMCP
jgi:hypothetical protein